MKNLNLITEETTERCKFRLLEEKDLNDVYEILSDEDVITNLNMNIHTSIEDTKALLEDYRVQFGEGKKLPIAIINKTDDRFIGVFLIKLDLYNEDAYEFTVYLKKEFWNKGLYSEILPLMTRFAFEIISMGNFRGYVMEKNNASARGLEKNGFELEKIFEVPGLEGRIKSYLITYQMYEKSVKK